MKLAKLSLAAIAVVGLSTSSFAADTLADAFKNGKVKGDIKAYYFMEDSGTYDADIFTTGLQLNYVTDSFNGFKFGATFQSSASPFVDEDGKNKFAGDMWGSGAVLSEAYLAYTMDKTTVKVGRQYISSPLVAGSGSRLVKQSFEGAVLVNTNIPNTTIILGYVDKYQNRTSGTAAATRGDIAGFDQVGGDNDGAYTVVAINKSITGLTLTGAYADVADTVALMYAEAVYAGKSDTFTYAVAGQYNDTNYDAAASDDSGYYGVKVSMGMNGLNAYVAYAAVDKDNAAVSGLGSGTLARIYTSSIINSGQYAADSSGYAIDANYKMGAAKVGARYVDLDLDATDATDKRTNIYGSYMFDGALKGLGLDLTYEKREVTSTADHTEYWVKTTYKF